MREYQHVIYQNIVKGMQVLVDAREKLNIAWEQPATEAAAESATTFHSGIVLSPELFHQYAPTLQALWQDQAIRTAYDRRREFQIVSELTATKETFEINDFFFSTNFYRVIQLITFSMKSNEYRDRTIFHHTRIFCIAERQQKVFTNLQ